MSGILLGFLRSRLVALTSVATAAIVAPLAMAVSAQAATTFKVNDTKDATLASSAGKTCASTDGQKCTLRAAVQAADNLAGSGAVSVMITLPAGHYKLTKLSLSADDPSNGDLDVKAGLRLTVKGDGAGKTVIDGNRLDRAFAVQPSSGPLPAGNLTLDGLSIVNGSADTSITSLDNSTDDEDGGAIFSDGTLTVNRSAILDSGADGFGGGIYAIGGAGPTNIIDSNVSDDASYGDGGGGVEVEGGTLTVIGSTVYHDRAYAGSGGGIGAYFSGAVTISHTQVDRDVAAAGGGVAVTNVSFSVAHSDISNDTADDGEGAGLNVADSGSHSGDEVQYTSLRDDTGAFEGGGLYTDSSSALLLERDVFSGDTAFADGGSGGAIADQTGSTGQLAVEFSTLSDNSAIDGGAVFDDEPGSTHELLIGDTFAGNIATEGGGALYASAKFVLVNDTIARNRAGWGGGVDGARGAQSVLNTVIADNGGRDCYLGPVGTAADGGYNIDSDGTCFSAGGVAKVPEVAHDRIDANARLGALAANGGVGETMALLPGSPAIGHGVCGVLNIKTDERGVPLPTKSGCDIGAFQTAAADLALSASHRAKANAGSRLTLTFTIANDGPGPALGTKFTDRLPNGVKLVGAKSSVGRCSGKPTVTCSIGSLDSKNTGSAWAKPTTVKVTLTVIPVKSGVIKDSATVHGSSSDPRHGNNTATLSLQVT